MPLLYLYCHCSYVFTPLELEPRGTPPPPSSPIPCPLKLPHTCTICLYSQTHSCVLTKTRTYPQLIRGWWTWRVASSSISRECWNPNKDYMSSCVGLGEDSLGNHHKGLFVAPGPLALYGRSLGPILRPFPRRLVPAGHGRDTQRWGTLRGGSPACLVYVDDIIIPPADRNLYRIRSHRRVALYEGKPQLSGYISTQ